MWSLLWCSRRSHDIDPPLEPKNVKEEVAVVLDDLIKSVELTAPEPLVEPVVEPALEPVVEPAAQAEPLVSPKKSKKLPAYMYNHLIWPSPRAVNFVRNILTNKNRYPIYKKFANSTQIEGRLSHEKALNALASFAHISLDQLLTITPSKYHDTYLFTTENYTSIPYDKFNYRKGNYELYGIQ